MYTLVVNNFYNSDNYIFDGFYCLFWSTWLIDKSCHLRQNIYLLIEQNGGLCFVLTSLLPICYQFVFIKKNAHSNILSRYSLPPTLNIKACITNLALDSPSVAVLYIKISRNSGQSCSQ